MYRVNLLPWRQRRRRRRARAAMLALAAELLLAVAIMGVQAHGWRHEHAEREISLAQCRQRVRQARALGMRQQQSVAQLAALKTALDSQDRVKERNQRCLRVLEHLSALLPPGTWLTRFQQDGQLSLSGCSHTYQDLASTNDRFKGHALFAAARWLEIRQSGNGHFSFELQTAAGENP